MSNGSKKSKDGACEKGSKHFTRGDYGLLLDWLEVPANYDSLYGSKQKTKVGSRPVVRAKAYDQMAEHINTNQRKGSKLPLIDRESMKTRWGYYWKRYMKASKASQSTGFGLTDSDIASGFKSIQEKLENECPFFSRVNDLFRGQPNVGNEWPQYRSEINGALVTDAAQEDAGQTSIAGGGAPTNNAVDEPASEPLHRSPVVEEQLAYSPEVNLEGEEMSPDPFVPDSVPINHGDMVPDSINPASPGEDMPTVEMEGMTMDRGIERPQANGSHDGPRRGGDVRAQAPQPRGSPIRQQPSQEQADPGVPNPAQGRSATGRPTRDRGRRGGEDNIAAESGNVEPEDGRSPPEKSGVATGRIHGRTRSQSLGQDRGYPNKKQVTESRHSINSAFAANLENQNLCKERLNELRAERLEQDRLMEEKRFAWQQEVHLTDRQDQRSLEEKKLVWDRERFQEEQALKHAELESARAERDGRAAEKKAELEAARADRIAMHDIQMKLAVFSSNRTLEDIEKLLRLFGNS